MAFLARPDERYELLGVSYDEMKNYGRGNPDVEANPVFKAECIAIAELADRADEESLECLARAAANPESHWDTERAYIIASTITDIGRPCLPHLRSVAKGPQVEFVRGLIDLIERDEGW